MMRIKIISLKGHFVLVMVGRDSNMNCTVDMQGDGDVDGILGMTILF